MKIMYENILSTSNIVGSIFLIIGMILFLFPPKKINKLYGYRTSNSMENIERWNYAQTLSSKRLIISGLLLLTAGIVGLVFPSIQGLVNSIGLSASVLMIIFIYIKTESDIVKKFGSIM